MKKTFKVFKNILIILCMTNMAIANISYKCSVKMTDANTCPENNTNIDTQDPQKNILGPTIENESLFCDVKIDIILHSKRLNLEPITVLKGTSSQIDFSFCNLKELHNNICNPNAQSDTENINSHLSDISLKLFSTDEPGCKSPDQLIGQAAMISNKTIVYNAGAD